MKGITFIYDATRLGHANATRRIAAALKVKDLEVGEIAVTPDQWEKRSYPDIFPSGPVVQCFIPPLLRPLEGRNNIAIVFHEWDRMPAHWIGIMNSFDEIWACSGYLERVFRACGCTIPIFKAPIPIPFKQIRRKDDWETRRPFRFLSVGEWHFRKGFHLLRAAFQKAFREPGEAELIIKTSSDADYSPPVPHVRILREKFSERQLLGLYADYDAYVTTSLAEGFGLPAAEAMAAGLPVLAPTWSGLADFCGSGRSFELPFKIVPQPYCSRPDFYAPGQQCCLVDVDGCAEVLRGVVSADAKERQAVAKRSLAFIIEKLDPGVIGKELAEHLIREK